MWHSFGIFANFLLIDGLALSGNAPKIFTKVTGNGLPLVSLIFCAVFSALAYMGVTTGSGKVFNWFVNSKSFSYIFFLGWYSHALV